MAEFFLRPKALEDLERIWFYTFENWGEEQADHYIYNIESVFRVIAEKPGMGRSCDDIRKGYRKHFVGKHVIFYRMGKKGIEIVRLLHHRMDPGLHLE